MVGLVSLRHLAILSSYLSRIYRSHLPVGLITSSAYASLFTPPILSVPARKSFFLSFTDSHSTVEGTLSKGFTPIRVAGYIVNVLLIYWVHIPYEV